jgi:hypothetical protein
MFEHLHYKTDISIKPVKWEFEVEERWLPYKILSFNIFLAEKKFFFLG